MTRSRSIIYWFGPAPDPAIDAAINARNLIIRRIEHHTLEDFDFIGACGILYNFTALSFESVKKAAEETIGHALNHGLLTCFVAENDAVQGYVANLVDVLSVPQLSRHLKTYPPPENIAQTFAGHTPGRPYKADVTIEPAAIAEALGSEDAILLRRAFSDCTKINLTHLVPGKTADVFLVHATFDDTFIGPRPVPFFAKLGLRHKIEREQLNYRNYARHFIEFHLCPRLDDPRCLVGSTRGILVGDFVDRSEPLAACVRRGEATGAIHALFDVTLANWHAQGYLREPMIGSIAYSLTHQYDCKRTRAEYLGVAATYGVTATPSALWASLLSLPSVPYRSAPMHGDLHCENIRVRHGDAILIDLGSVASGPLTADLASLEVSLMLDLPWLETDDAAMWRAMIDDFYAPDGFAHLIPPRFDIHSLTAVWSAARQVRLMALPCQTSPREYQTAVAIFLLRRTMFPATTANELARNSYAYVVGTRLIEDLHVQR